MKRLMALLKGLGYGQGGYAVVATAVGFIAMAIPITLASVQLSDTLTHSSSVNRDNLLHGSASSGAVEHAVWRLVYETGYADSLTPDAPTDQYQFTMNDITTQVSVTSLTGEPPEVLLQVIKTVSPKYAPEETPTTFTYTVTIINDDTVAHEITEIEDHLPSHFDYVEGSASGLTSDDPAVNGEENKLTWEFSAPYPVVPPKGGELTLQFQATSDQDEGTRHNRVDVVVEGLGEYKTGPTAQVRFLDDDEGQVDVTVSVDPSVAMAGEETEFTYTIYMYNNDVGDGDDDDDDGSHEIKEITNILPAGFTYVVSSTSGVTLDDPHIDPDPQRLEWRFSEPYPVIGPQSGVELTFRATATLAKATYFDQAIVSLKDLSGSIRDIETGPTAPVRGILDTFRIEAEGPEKGIDAKVGIFGTTADFLSWEER